MYSYFSDDTVSADIKLETETEDGLSGEDVPSTLSPNMYHPRQALRNAINEWLPEFSKHKTAWGPIAKPQPAVAGKSFISSYGIIISQIKLSQNELIYAKLFYFSCTCSYYTIHQYLHEFDIYHNINFNL